MKNGHERRQKCVDQQVMAIHEIEDPPIIMDMITKELNIEIKKTRLIYHAYENLQEIERFMLIERPRSVPKSSTMLESITKRSTHSNEGGNTGVRFTNGMMKLLSVSQA